MMPAPPHATHETAQQAPLLPLSAHVDVHRLDLNEGRIFETILGTRD
jgi:hypothetical protein